MSEFLLQRDALMSAGVDERNIFEDKASGSKDDRVGLAKALEYVKEGNTLVVWKLDRLGRSLPHLIEIVSHLKAKGVGFKSLTEGMDTSSPSGELLFHVFGALAQFERSLIQERVNTGLAAARKRGRIGGRPRAIPQEKIDAILLALNNGMSKAAVCRTFDVKRSTLIDVLNRINSNFEQTLDN
ncbi:recombinase family protein [Sulfuricurvum sp.]|uniref:recombinase family protein n=1 Tax=Sulfuricurvum sp. TaxID=2025608 RepID=UPI0035649EBE